LAIIRKEIANTVKELLSVPKLLITPVKLVILDELLILTYVLRRVVVQDVSYNDV
jgi:hypothetical protein